MDPPLERRDAVSEIWHAVEQLPVGLRMALLLRDVAGLQYAEIADVLEITLPTVKWRIFKARETVALALSRADAQEQTGAFAAAGR